MTGNAPLVFPGGRILAGWWRQLAPWQPQALWVGHLLLHRVEALVGLTRARRADPFTLLTLKALASGQTLASLEQCLHLERSLLRQVLRQLVADRLAEQGPADQWFPTLLGRQALEQGNYAGIGQERRVFYFVESELPQQPPHFVHLPQPACEPWPAAEEWGFDVRILEACIQRPPAWKEAHGFPAEVQSVLAVETAQLESWQRVILHRPERLSVVLALTSHAPEKERLLGFAVQSEGWVLQTAEPVFALGPAWPETFPELAQEIPLDQWRQTWLAWCQPRNLPAPEVETCLLQRQDHRLQVAASHRLLERLRAARSDALKGEAWLLAGTGRLRTAAMLEVVEARPRKVEGERGASAL